MKSVLILLVIAAIAMYLIIKWNPDNEQDDDDGFMSRGL